MPTNQEKARFFLAFKASGDPRCNDLLLKLSLVTGLSTHACMANIMALAAGES